MSSLSIIIVNWNTGALLAQCLESLEGLAERDLITQVVVIDNNSSDDSLTQAKAGSYQIPIHWIDLDYNAGFAKANNIGIDWVIHTHGRATHTLLLNPDTEVKQGALPVMLNVLERNQQVGIVGSKLVEPGGHLQASVHYFPTFWTFLAIFFKLHRLFPNTIKDQASLTKETIVDEVKGAAFLIRDATLQDIGPLDEDFWILFEEVDYCRRAKNAGWQTMYTPNAAVLHYGGVSFSRVVGFKKSVPFLMSALQYIKKHLGVLAYGFFILMMPLALLLTIPATITHLFQKRA